MVVVQFAKLIQNILIAKHIHPLLLILNYFERKGKVDERECIIEINIDLFSFPRVQPDCLPYSKPPGDDAPVHKHGKSLADSSVLDASLGENLPEFPSRRPRA